MSGPKHPTISGGSAIKRKVTGESDAYSMQKIRREWVNGIQCIRGFPGTETRIREGMINKITCFPSVGMVESGIEVCVVIHTRGKDERTV